MPTEQGLFRDAAWLRARYEDDRMSVQAIATLCRVRYKAIEAEMNRHGIVRRPGPGHQAHPLLDDSAWLRDRYERDRLSLQHISGLAGVSPPTVAAALARHGIAKRTAPNAAGSLPRSSVRPVVPPSTAARERLARNEQAESAPTKTCRVCKGTGAVRDGPRLTSTQKGLLKQDQTRPYATRHYDEWTSAELEALATTTLSHRDLALQLGRSYSAVKTMKRKLLNGTVALPPAHGPAPAEVDQQN